MEETVQHVCSKEEPDNRSQKDCISDSTNINSNSLSSSNSKCYDVHFVEPFRKDLSFIESMLLDIVTAVSGYSSGLNMVIYGNIGPCRKDEELGHKVTQDVIRQLDDHDLGLVARFCCHMCNIANFAEWSHRKRRRQAHERMQVPGDYCATEQILEHVIQSLINDKFAATEIYDALKVQVVEFVLTAHPTQCIRASLIRNYREIGYLLLELDQRGLSKWELDELHEKFQRCLEIIWRTDVVQRSKPTAYHEAEWIRIELSETVWSALPKFLRKVDNCLLDQGLPRLPLNSRLFKFSSWAGGDRDGNPYVTAKVTMGVVLENRLLGIDLFLKMITKLAETVDVYCDDEDITKLASEFPIDNRHLEAMGFSKFWESLKFKLMETRKCVLKALESSNLEFCISEHAFKNTCEFKKLLVMAYDTLCRENCQLPADGLLLDTIRLAEAFGLNFLALDLRFESIAVWKAIKLFFNKLDSSVFFENKDLGFEYLVPRFKNGPFIVNSSELAIDVSKLNNDLLDTLKTCVSQFGEEGFSAFIISLCDHPFDVLATVYLESMLVPEENRIRVVPLFETEEGIKSAESVFSKLFCLEGYRAFLSKFGNVQEVMVGYSDSGMSLGRLTSSWLLYQTQEQLVKLGQKFDIRFRFFHGRGGSIGRGGGPQHLAILSQPCGSVNGDMRVTIQGEVITQDFGMKNMVARTCEAYLTAVLKTTFQSKKNQNKPLDTKPLHDLMDRMADISNATYNRIVNSEVFSDFLLNFLNIMDMSKLNIGSRPSSRRNSGITALRAIPWMFVWNQIRIMLPCWLGVGEAIEDAFEHGNGNKLRETYKTWPFLKSFFDLISMCLIKTNETIFEAYIRSFASPTQKSFGMDLLASLTKTKRLVLALTGETNMLDNDPLTQRVINARKRWLEPASLIQLELLERQRRNIGLNYDDSLLVSIKAVAAGIQNTG